MTFSGSFALTRTEDRRFATSLKALRSAPWGLAERLRLLGGIGIAAAAMHTLLSYGLAPARFMFVTTKFTLPIVDALGLDGALGSFVNGRTFQSHTIYLVAVLTLMAVQTVVFLAMLRTCLGSREQPTADTPKLILRLAMAMGAVMALAVPILAGDFWMSIAWGRIGLDGLNPYYVGSTEAIVHQIPLRVFPMTMTYGPLWGLISVAVTGLGLGNAYLVALLFKGLLWGAWVGCLMLVDRLLSDEPLTVRCAALLWLGCTPFSLLLFPAEGHNDVAMMFFVLAWLLFVREGRYRWATSVLVAATLVKYVTAPLLALDMILHIRRRGLGSYLRAAAVAGALAIACFAVFVRDLQFFGQLGALDYVFFRPADAVRALGSLLGIPTFRIGQVVAAGFMVLVPVGLLRFLMRRGERELRIATLFVLAGLVLGVAPHVWPWYLIWALPAAVLVPGTLVARGVLALSLAFPPALYFFQASLPQATVAVYAGGLLIFLLMPRLGLLPEEAAPADNAHTASSVLSAGGGT